MATRSRERALPSTGDAIELFRALSDPTRLSIMQQMAAVDELACTTLEDTLPVTKATISYHVKILYHAGLVTVRKQGRNYFYKLRRDSLDSLLPGLADRLDSFDAPPDL